MRNHERLLGLRRRGRKPAGPVWLSVAAYPHDAHQDVRRHFADHVFIEPSDIVDRLDLRVFVGLEIHVDGSDPDRVRAVFDALQRHNARRVIASCGRAVRGVGEIDFILDSCGALTWQA